MRSLLLPSVLPEGLLDNFDIVSFEQLGDVMEFLQNLGQKLLDRFV